MSSEFESLDLLLLSQMGFFQVADDGIWERDIFNQEDQENELTAANTGSVTGSDSVTGSVSVTDTETENCKENKVNKPSFVEFDENEKENFIEKMKNKNTVKKTESTMRQFDRFLKQAPRNEMREAYQIMPAELDNYIGLFMLSIRKGDGSEYEPDTLTSYHRGIDRYLKENKYPHSIIQDKEFASSRTVLASKRKELKEKGKGTRPNASEPISTQEKKIILEKGLLGLNTPETLLNTLWLNNTTLFGIRGCSENHNLRWGT